MMRNIKNDVVSFDNESLILVDSSGNEIGTMNKLECHQGAGKLHRAFSVFLFNEKGELLIQQRSASKTLWPLFWSNSCCSHPRKGETMIEAVNRRLYDELGLSEFSLKYIYQFSYVAKYRNIGTEKELCSVYLGKIGSEINVNLNEINDSKFVSKDELDELLRVGETNNPWFLMEWRELNLKYNLELKDYIT